MKEIPWASRQKLRYTLGIILVLLLLVGYPVYVIIHAVFYQPPTCFDGKQNQDEENVDCGGICERICVGMAQPLSVVWVRTLPGADGYYDVAAKIDNLNAGARLESFGYVIKIYDASDVLIYKKEGEDYADAGERFLVFEPNIYLGDDKPYRTEIEITGSADWLSSDRKTISLKIVDKELLHTENGSRLNALVQHQGIVGSYSDIDIYAVISDITGKPVGISQTYIKSLIAGDDKNIFFTWPVSLKEQTAGLCENRASLPTELLIPSDVMLVFDRSGSMNNDSNDPPQPITNAKEAAKEFANRMLGVDRVGLVSFATEASFPIDQGLTYEQQEIKEAIDDIIIGTPDHEQHTNLGDGIKKALKELEKNSRDKAKKAVIVLTDGVASRPLDPTDASYAEKYATLQAAQAVKQDTLLYVIGLGEDINSQLLTFDVASSPEKFYQAASSEELSRVYTDIAQAVCEEDVFLYEIYIRISDKDTL